MQSSWNYNDTYIKIYIRIYIYGYCTFLVSGKKYPGVGSNNINLTSLMILGQYPNHQLQTFIQLHTRIYLLFVQTLQIFFNSPPSAILLKEAPDCQASRSTHMSFLSVPATQTTRRQSLVEVLFFAVYGASGKICLKVRTEYCRLVRFMSCR